ncbi:hypothetical protein MUP32_06680 [Candidatus Microgenomates bacterium]|nr:hypothetical protein [Candidatus Microgenomates bacterium]
MDQIKILRLMTGEERLKQAIELSQLTRDLSCANIKEQLGKKASKKAILQKLMERLEYGRERNT